MRNYIHRLGIAAVMTIASGTVALAQSAMTVDVPFTFTTPAGTMQPGRYAMERMPGASAQGMFRLMNQGSRQQALLLASDGVKRTASGQQKAALEFKCAGEMCALYAVYPAFSETGLAFRTKLRKAPENNGTVAQILIPATE